MKGKGGKIAKLANEKETVIRRSKYRYPDIQDIGKKRGSEVQKHAVEESVRLFNGLALKNKIDFLQFIFGFDRTKPLLNATIEDKTPKIYWSEDINSILKGDITAGSGNEKGYYISIGGKRVIRIQVNFTNGIGLSAFCERAFLAGDLNF